MATWVHRIVLGLLYAVTFASLAYFSWTGLDYYRTPLAERPHLAHYWRLKPGGSVGHPLGVAGSAMMVLMLGYSLRKRLGMLRRWGALSRWLDYHIFLGIAGPLFVVLHSSFKVHGLVALSFWSMLVVAASGVAGRFLYLQIPRTQAGDELTLDQVEARDRRLARRLTEELGLPEEAVAELDAVAVHGLDPAMSLPALGLRAVADYFTFGWRLRRFRRRYRHVDRHLLRRFERTVRQKAVLHRRLLLWRHLRRLFHYWHVFHKPFAAVMYLFMVLHVAVAVATGYGWGARG